jgi:sec-independent protein translocase protein TatA
MKFNIIAGQLGFTEILLILVIILVLFGGSKIPELMKGLGKGIKEFKSATKEDGNETTKKSDGKAE